ncbi:hypothetical protein [Treponema sp. R80B11-R83G3]
MDNVVGSLTAINKTLEKLNDIMRQVADTMPKPASKFISVLETIVLISSALGFIVIVDVIVKWIIGG